MAVHGARIGTVFVRPLGEEDRQWRDEALVGAWGSTSVARKGVVIDAGALPGFVALVHGFRVGLLVYAAAGDGASGASGGDDIEVVSLHVERGYEGGGVGRALMDAVRDHAGQVGAGRIWLVTNNDNTRAIRFYQRWGMDLGAFFPDAVAASRRVKPSIPMIGQDGIPVRHELEFRLTVGRGPGAGDSVRE